MMKIEDKVYPVRGKHSIKEVVISLFLAEPIKEPGRFEDLINTAYKDLFQKFEPVSQLQVQFQKGGKGHETKFSHNTNAGFKFISGQGGKTERMLQGINEPNRTFISYHSLNYDRWDSFLNEYKETITALTQVHPELSITAFSLHYIDELIWKDKNTKMDKKVILKYNTEKIPGDFFKSGKPVFSLISERENGGSLYYDRLEIRVNTTPPQSLIISHNVTENLDNEILINQLFNSEFEQKLNIMHSYNKELLADILPGDVQKLIGLQ